MTKKNLTFRDFGLKENPFPELGDDPIEFGGIGCSDLLQFAFYQKDISIGGVPLRKLLPFAAALWHFKNPLGDMFSGEGTAIAPWDDGTGSFKNAKRALRVFYYMCYLLGIDYWCWHDLDLVSFGDSMEEFHANIDRMLPVIAELSELTGIKVGWTTQNLFSHPKYTEGAATNPDLGVFRMAWAQTRKMLDVAKWLQENDCGATHHTFWGGREGYSALMATMLGKEKRQLAAFLHLAVNYAKQIGLKIQFQIEPKPMEPSTHQYDRNVDSVLGFLREFDLLEHFGLNVETNHAQLDGHNVDHELVSGGDKVTGIDANQGTFGNGWDTDEFPSDLMIAFQTIYPVMMSKKGILNGYINFDAKRRRGSFAPMDLFYSHISGMDVMALAAAMSAVIIKEGNFHEMLRLRYETWNSDQGRAIERYIDDPTAVDPVALAEQGYDEPLELEVEDSFNFIGMRMLIVRSLPRAIEMLDAA